ncbi:MAG: hypothetical protein ACREF1_05035, partial [Acetobacteraceae bacterium]
MILRGTGPTPPAGTIGRIGGSAASIRGATERPRHVRHNSREIIMAWTRPTLREICIGLEISGYLPGTM